jgi:hypothetical protein
MLLNGRLPLTDPGAVFAALFLVVLLGPLLAKRARLPGLAGLMFGKPNAFNARGRDALSEPFGHGDPLLEVPERLAGNADGRTGERLRQLVVGGRG